MARKRSVLIDKPHNGGQWTPARFHSFIKSALRQASMRWPPKHEIKKKARVDRGKYLCNGCKQVVPVSVRVDDKRRSNVHVDHIIPVIDPAKGFVSWDDAIERMFCEEEGLQVLCAACHKVITAEERLIAKERKQQEKVDV